MYITAMGFYHLIHVALQDNNQGAADTYAREALSHWKTLVSQPGCWDPFVLRHAEVLSHSLL